MVDVKGSSAGPIVGAYKGTWWRAIIGGLVILIGSETEMVLGYPTRRERFSGEPFEATEASVLAFFVSLAIILGICVALVIGICVCCRFDNFMLEVAKRLRARWRSYKYLHEDPRHHDSSDYGDRSSQERKILVPPPPAASTTPDRSVLKHTAYAFADHLRWTDYHKVNSVSPSLNTAEQHGGNSTVLTLKPIGKNGLRRSQTIGTDRGRNRTDSADLDLVPSEVDASGRFGLLSSKTAHDRRHPRDTSDSADGDQLPPDSYDRGLHVLDTVRIRPPPSDCATVGAPNGQSRDTRIEESRKNRRRSSGSRKQNRTSEYSADRLDRAWEPGDIRSDSIEEWEEIRRKWEMAYGSDREEADTEEEAEWSDRSQSEGSAETCDGEIGVFVITDHDLTDHLDRIDTGVPTCLIIDHDEKPNPVGVDQDQDADQHQDLDGDYVPSKRILAAKASTVFKAALRTVASVSDSEAYCISQMATVDRGATTTDEDEDEESDEKDFASSLTPVGSSSCELRDSKRTCSDNMDGKSADISASGLL